MTTEKSFNNVLEIKAAGLKCCELCARNGVATVATTVAGIDHEYKSNEKVTLPSCAACADMLENA